MVLCSLAHEVIHYPTWISPTNPNHPNASARVRNTQLAQAAPAGRSDIRGPYGVDLHLSYDGKLTNSLIWSGDVSGSVSWDSIDDFVRIRETASGTMGSAETVFAYDADQLLTCASPTTCNPAGADALKFARNASGVVSTIVLGNTSETLTYNAFGEIARQTAKYGSASLVENVA